MKSKILRWYDAGGPADTSRFVDIRCVHHYDSQNYSIKEIQIEKKKRNLKISEQIYFTRYDGESKSE